MKYEKPTIEQYGNVKEITKGNPSGKNDDYNGYFP